LSAKGESVGYVAAGALASVADDVTGIATDGGIDGGEIDGVVAPATAGVAAAKLADDGVAAGVKPAIATACGVDCAEGSAGGVAERATTDESTADLSFFHQAKRGAVWQPTIAPSASNNVDKRMVVRIIL
jgi:hypothetical protein